MHLANRLKDKNAVIFGGGSPTGKINNGLATGIVYALEGARLTVVDVDQAAVDIAVERIKQECAQSGMRPQVMGCVADVTDERAVAAAVDTSLEAYGRIDVLHNNVGVVRMGGPETMQVGEWEAVLRVNLTSAFITTHHVLPLMLEQGAGTIVNIASVGGLRYIGYNYPSYSATKGALIEFTKNIALQHASNGIRANTVAPGYIASPMMYEQISSSYDSVEQMMQERNALSPTGRMGEPFDVAHAALFLASDEAKYVNGVCLPVDGGLIQQAAFPVDLQK